MKAGVIAFLSLILAFSLAIPSARAGTTNNTGFFSISPPGYSGTYVAGDWWYRGDGSTRTVTQLKPYIEYQGNRGDNAYIKFELYEIRVDLAWTRYCISGTCVWGPTGATIKSETQKWSLSLQASSNTDLNWARNNPNQGRWATISIGNVQITTSTSQSPPACCNQAVQTVYYEYATIDQNGWHWGVGYWSGLAGPTYYCNGICSMAVATWDYNLWGGNNWWQFNVPSVSGNIELTMQETWS